MSTFEFRGEDDRVDRNLAYVFCNLRHLHDGAGHGGYFVIADGETGIVEIMRGMGAPLRDKVSRYQTNALEKAARLAAKPNDVSSFQSRTEGVTYAGAIRARVAHSHVILSFSGLPELLDEAIVLAVARQSGLITPEDANAIAAISQNSYYPRVLELTHQR